MDEPASSGQYRHVRRLGIWLLLVFAAATYLSVTVWVFNAEPVPTGAPIWAFLLVPSMVVAGVFLLVKRPGHPIGELLTLSGIAFPVTFSIFEAPTHVVFRQSGAQPWTWAAIWASQTALMVGLVLAVWLLVLLPDGRPRHTRERRFLRFASILVVFPTLAMVANERMVTPELLFRGVTNIPSPLFIDALQPFGRLLVALNTLGYSVLLGASALLFMRYRAASTRERKQIRWVLLAGVMIVVVGVIPSIGAEFGVTAPIGDSSTPQAALIVLLITLFPASVVVAVMEPPWLDVDIVIRKSFVYGALSVGILAVYVGAAASLGAAGVRLGLPVELAVVLTVVIALTFEPTRRRLQAIADRWVFGTRPTKYEAVTDFGATIEQAAEPDELLPRLVETIRDTLRLDWAVAVLNNGTRAETGSVHGKPALQMPIGIGDGHIGQIICGPKAAGALDDSDVQLVRTLAGQLGLAIMNGQLAGRIVTAAEAERRRIERNIHDGAQQELVALVARLAMARSAAGHGRLTAEAIDDLRLEAQRILSDLRELAQGIHPTVLSDGGILEAVEERCARLPLEVSLHVSDGLRARRFHDDVEGGAYFFVTESLANVLKHASATRVTVSLSFDDGRLLLEVVDDGRGFDPDTTFQNGLAGIDDRIRALGGTVTVSSRGGEGTRLAAALPVDGS
jgi:signal transduction histidine kinase